MRRLTPRNAVAAAVFILCVAWFAVPPVQRWLLRPTYERVVYPEDVPFANPLILRLPEIHLADEFPQPLPLDLDMEQWKSMPMDRELHASGAIMAPHDGEFSCLVHLAFVRVDRPEVLYGGKTLAINAVRGPLHEYEFDFRSPRTPGTFRLELGIRYRGERKLYARSPTFEIVRPAGDPGQKPGGQGT